MGILLTVDSAIPANKILEGSFVDYRAEHKGLPTCSSFEWTQAELDYGKDEQQRKRICLI